MPSSNRLKLVVLASLAMVSGRLPAASVVSESADGPGASPKIRTGGVYYRIVDHDKDVTGVALCTAVRLYEDGTAIDADFYGKPADLVTWFDRGNEAVFPGTWTLDGEHLTVVVSRGFSEATRSGTLTPEGWRVTDTVTLAFAPLPFPPAQARSGGNRRPYFTGHGDSAIRHDYDRAGNLSGINHQLEVQAVDPDGDPLEFTWTSSNGTLEPDGPRVVWKRPLESGRPLPGEIGVEVSDGKGGRVSLREAIE